MDGRRKLGAAAAVLALEAGLIALLLLGLAGGRTGQAEQAGLKVFAVAPEVPPPLPPTPKPEARPARPKPEGARRSVLVAVPPIVPRYSPDLTALSLLPELGSGSGEGVEGSGDGGGGNGIMIPARQIRGGFRGSDFPRSSREAEVLAVSVEFTVLPTGRAVDCAVTSPSGYAEVDAMTCRVIERRYRFEPARDETGRAIAQRLGETHRWTRHDTGDGSEPM